MFRLNIGIKVFSLLLAVFLWVQSVLMSEHKTTVNLPVNLTDLPAHVALDDVPRSIPFSVRGKGIDILRLVFKGTMVNIDASNLRAGAIQLPITNYHIELPENVNLEILKPVHEEQIPVQTDIYDRKTVPVELTFNSTAARNIFQSGRYLYHPKSVSIYGPRRILEQINQVRTQAISPTMLTRPSVEIGMELPAPNVSVLDPHITIEMVTDDVQQRIIGNIPLYWDSGRQATPNRITIKVEGSKDFLQSLKASDFRARVLPEPDQNGFHKVIVELPDNVILIDITPSHIVVNESY